MKSYADRTYNNKNPIIRFAHRQRIKKSTQSIALKEHQKILDFGCGDGQFLATLKKHNPNNQIELIGFEPYQNTKQLNDIVFFNNYDNLKRKFEQNKFDIITCFEVLEHFNEKNQIKIINQILPLLKANGLFIISVPIEIGFPSLIKNLIRKVNYPGQEIYSFKNILKAFIHKPVQKYRKNDGYLPHMGFNHKELEKTLQKFFIIKTKKFSPFKIFGSTINSQVFYFLLKKSQNK